MKEVKQELVLLIFTHVFESYPRARRTPTFALIFWCQGPVKITPISNPRSHTRPALDAKCGGKGVSCAWDVSPRPISQSQSQFSSACHLLGWCPEELRLRLRNSCRHVSYVGANDRVCFSFRDKRGRELTAVASVVAE